MAVLRQAAQFVKVEQNMPAELNTTQQTAQFSDIAGHWGEDLITANVCLLSSSFTTK